MSEIVVEFLGSKGWEIALERPGRVGSPAWASALLEAKQIEAEGYSVRVTLLLAKDKP